MTMTSAPAMHSKQAMTAEQAQALAQATAAAMWTRDRTANALEMRILDVKPGYAKLAMKVRADMLNGHHICHGGMIFTLADTAFAYACNSHNHNTVASACQIDFLAPAKENDTLEAEAVEQALAGRSGVYDITVYTAAGQTVALFRGKSRRIAGEVIAGFQQADHAPQ
jgi:acyl-CoA thioesterase